ncbi:cytochrome P450 71A25-like [Silene latifolia]|uniref:cytochrome P450 71A25-like n=1 Tax=Silene latifolia TaxID=37657 RepID=UPI003D77CF4A
MLLHLGNRPTLVVSSANLAEEIMKTHDTNFANRPKFKVGSIVVYDGRDIALSNYGEYWRKLKSICVAHILSNKKVQSFRNVREEEVSLIVECIRENEPSAPVNLSDIIISFTNDVISRAAFGRKYVGEGGGVSIKSLLDELTEAFGTANIGDFIPWLSWIDHLSGVIRKSNKVAKGFDMFLEKLVQEHIDQQKFQSHSDYDADKGDKVKDLVDVLIEIQRNDSSIERDNIKALPLDALLLNVLATGVETTSTALEWAMSELLIDPHAMKKLQDEVRVFSYAETIINEDDLKNMKYLKAVIKETLKLHPPLPLLLFHQSSHDVKVGDYDIAARTQVFINVWAIQKHLALWDQPEEFRPERFMNTSLDLNEKDFKFVPFGAGKRGCPGISLAAIKAELVLANLVGKFNWELPNGIKGSSFMAESSGTTAHRRDPLILIPTRYSLDLDK